MGDPTGEVDCVVCADVGAGCVVCADVGAPGVVAGWLVPGLPVPLAPWLPVKTNLYTNAPAMANTAMIAAIKIGVRNTRDERPAAARPDGDRFGC